MDEAEERLSGHEYADLIAAYVLKNYDHRGLSVYREVSIGKTIIGKDRRIDVLIVGRDGASLAIECKYQSVKGTVDEKIPYALDDLKAMMMPVSLAYAGDGFSSGILHMLEASPLAAYAYPDKATLRPTRQTRELDAAIAMVFKWWDVLLAAKQQFKLCDWKEKVASGISIPSPPPDIGDR